MHLNFVPRIATGPLPNGFEYLSDFVSPAEESELLASIRSLEFVPFNFQGYVAKRRIVEYGWEYDFGTRKTSTTQPLPEFLLPLLTKVAQAAAVDPGAIVEAVVTEYPLGAPIGWHRDVPQFEAVMGISLASACRMRFKPYRAEGHPISVTLELRSLYILRDDARWKFQHSIHNLQQLRYSITFRTLRARNQPQGT